MWLTPTLCSLQQGRGTAAPSGPLRGQLWGWGYWGGGGPRVIHAGGWET